MFTYIYVRLLHITYLLLKILTETLVHLLLLNQIAATSARQVRQPTVFNLMETPDLVSQESDPSFAQLKQTFKTNIFLVWRVTIQDTI